MNTIANKPFPLKIVGFAGYSTFLDGLIPPQDVALGPVHADCSIYTCEKTYILKPGVVKFRGAFDISNVWGTDNTEGVRLRLWSSTYENNNAHYEVTGTVLDLTWSWMDSEPRELCFLKAEFKTHNLHSAVATYALGMLERARKLWPKEIFNPTRWRSSSR